MYAQSLSRSLAVAYVVVHASQANAMTVVACGNLAPPTR